MTIYLDTHLDQKVRRVRLYHGDVFVYSPRPTTTALTAFARQLIEEAFAPLVPEEAQHELPVERFVEIVAPLKPRFIHHPRTLKLLRAVLCDLSGDAFFVKGPELLVALRTTYRHVSPP